ncbi:NAD-aldehyde dehydrogenase [Fomitopsis serialis]|uniref:NAD-aldehyde dehydrogenase n=1 Tax=Fomitopsis serialis TaxID=139415 RepID=UPI0020089F9F|nr:NAD-aldehyde dehydrogenase [Neoantrodia serialis]KAH9934346.1 NAD-aldehyde dehydrogenase [Neoantrodia serialis]
MAGTLQFTPVEDIPRIRNELGVAFNSGRTRSIAYRKQQLLQLCYLVEDNQECIRQVISSDLGRPHDETDVLEWSGTLLEIKDAYDSVEKWSAPQKSPFSLLWFSLSPVTRKEPKGVVLIISPFNYPFFLTLTPLAAAIAAGNTVMLKPSELTPASATFLAEVIPKYLDHDLVRVVNGGVPETTKILELRFNHILYTGNNRVAKIVCMAAAKHLTPVTLELGGKSPCVIDPKCNAKVAAKRIMWGKLVNCGQVCLCPDYVLVPESFQDEFVEALKNAYNELHPTDPKQSGMLGRIVNERHVERLKNLLDNTKGTIVFGGETDKDARYVAPTLIRDVKRDDSLMSEEIFGPLLPVVPVKDVDEAIAFVNSMDEALNVYIFSNDKKFKSKVMDNTRSGTASVNETILHVMANDAPFGGFGASGYGYSTGKAAFDEFTHFRCTVDNPNWVEYTPMSARYTPYNPTSLQRLVKFLHPSLPPRNGGSSAMTKLWYVVGLAVAGAVCASLAVIFL